MEFSIGLIARILRTVDTDIASSVRLRMLGELFWHNGKQPTNAHTVGDVYDATLAPQ